MWDACISWYTLEERNNAMECFRHLLRLFLIYDYRWLHKCINNILTSWQQLLWYGSWLFGENHLLHPPNIYYLWTRLVDNCRLHIWYVSKKDSNIFSMFFRCCFLAFMPIHSTKHHGADFCALLYLNLHHISISSSTYNGLHQEGFTRKGLCFIILWSCDWRIVCNECFVWIL